MKAASIFAPLRTPLYRNIWGASLVSNTGILIQGVGSAWAMATMSTPDMVALVQTAAFLPMACFAIPAGAIADMYDRRKVQLVALALAFLSALSMAVVSAMGQMTPWALLLFCFLVGCGFALFGPAWQSSVGEQVPAAMVPQAVALNGISYNIARALGPAAGGIIVAVAGVTAAFAANALLYIPMVLALFAWKRVAETSRLPPEGLRRAVSLGIRYIANMQPVRSAIIRSVVMGLLGAPLLSLMPLVSRDLLGGGASTFGLLLGCFGGGAILGIFVLQPLRRRGSEHVMRICGGALAVAVATLAFSSSVALSSLAMVFAGMAWMMVFAVLSISLQMFVPRWVVGRAVAALQAASALGIATGAWAWGTIARDHGVRTVLIVDATLLFVSPLLAFLYLRLADREAVTETVQDIPADPEVNLGITGRSGPIIVDLRYRIPTDRARDFYNLMREIQLIRARNGAYGWSLSRDIADPEIWVERCRFPTWNDYLRHRVRRTTDEAAIQRRASDMHFGMEPVRIQRFLERPFGSVRWSDETPDRGPTEPTMPAS